MKYIFHLLQKEFKMDKHKLLLIYWKYMKVDKPCIQIGINSNILGLNMKYIDLMKLIYKVCLKDINISSDKNRIKMFMGKKDMLSFDRPKSLVGYIQRISTQSKKYLLDIHIL